MDSKDWEKDIHTHKNSLAYISTHKYLFTPIYSYIHLLYASTPLPLCTSTKPLMHGYSHASNAYERTHDEPSLHRYPLVCPHRPARQSKASRAPIERRRSDTRRRARPVEVEAGVADVSEYVYRHVKVYM